MMQQHFQRMNQTRQCTECQAIYHRVHTESNGNWKKRKTCSYPCRMARQKKRRNAKIKKAA